MKYIKIIVIILFSFIITGCVELTDKKEITKSMKKSLPGIKVLNIENNEAERKNVYTLNIRI